MKVDHPSRKPFEVIALIDTGAQLLMMNPKLLPEDAWKKSEKILTSASGIDFGAGKETKEPVEVQLLPNCKIKIQVIGNSLPKRDLILGFDVFKQMGVILQPDGIKKGPHFRRLEEESQMWQLSMTDEVSQLKTQISLTLYAESHTEFMKKCDNPLWIREEFFIELPFKDGKIVNPTKASHSGMNPDHLVLARKECHELTSHGLIEESQSSWACEAFYVNKRAEQARGKLRLVINYQPLNKYLEDIKFPLP